MERKGVGRVIVRILGHHTRWVGINNIQKPPMGRGRVRHKRFPMSVGRVGIKMKIKIQRRSMGVQWAGIKIYRSFMCAKSVGVRIQGQHSKEVARIPGLCEPPNSCGVL